VPTTSINRRPWKVRLAVAGSRVALDRVEIWKQLQGTPQRISELEKRVAELEGKIGGKWPADVCKSSIVEREQCGCIASSAPFKEEKCANVGNAANAIEWRRAWSSAPCAAISCSFSQEACAVDVASRACA
jgi:hypothetical protein